VGSTWGSGGSGRSSPTVTTRSSPSPILRHGLQCTNSVAGSPGSAPAGSSAPEPTARRTPSWRRLTGERQPRRAHQLHTLTTQLARRYGTIVVEDLDVAAMARGMGRRAFRRSVTQAGIGKVRPLLTYKCPREGGRLAVADRWFASSKTHRGCGGYRADLRLGERVWHCPRCGAPVDRNANAALNLRDWTGPVAGDGDRIVQRGGVAAPVPLVGPHGGQARAEAWACEALEEHREVAGPVTPEPSPSSGSRGEEPRAGVPARERSQTLTELVTGGLLPGIDAAERAW
jgi:IS605 OrfB family transposase